MNPFDYAKSAFRGTPRALREHEQALSTKPSIGSGLAELRNLCSQDPAQDGDSPIFLLSAGWRAGSTLLQRLIMSDAKVLMWGEPYDECGIVQRMAETLKAFRAGWPPKDYFYSGSKPKSGDWVANLFPLPESLRRGHRAFFDAAFSEPAKAAGAQRWGVKEVRLNVEHAHYLRWLYPSAKIVFLYRNPLDAYRSYSRYGRNWYDIWPDLPIFTPTAFGTHWRELTAGFLRDATALNALIIRYEDLVQGTPQLLRSLQLHLDAQLDSSVLNKKVGSSERGGEKAWVSRLEKILLRRAVSPLAQELGYFW